MQVANSVYLVGDERLLTRKDLINDADHVQGIFKLEGEDDLLLFFCHPSFCFGLESGIW